jgi:ATP-dependent protease HslVU (ClpYQ) peptidase subunit
MVVADETHSLQITGTGDVLEPHDGIIGAFTAFQLRRCAVHSPY